MIKIDDLIPLLKPGFVAMDGDGAWHWFRVEPLRLELCKIWDVGLDIEDRHDSLNMFDITPFSGDWKDSLIEIKAKEGEK